MTDALFAMPESVLDPGREWTMRELGSAGGKFDTARGWVERWHYSHRMPGGGTRTFGLFAPDMACCVMTSIPNNVHGIATRYGLHRWPGNIEISRVVAHPTAPPNTASRSVAAVLHFYGSQRVEWLFSYADTGQGHHGGIYQALNGIYLGQSDARVGYLLDGKPVHPRSLVSSYGTQAWPAIRDIIKRATGETIERVEGLNTAKHTYVLPCGTPASRRAIRRHLAPITKPYPKRTTEDAP